MRKNSRCWLKSVILLNMRIIFIEYNRVGENVRFLDSLCTNLSNFPLICKRLTQKRKTDRWWEVVMLYFPLNLFIVEPFCSILWVTSFAFDLISDGFRIKFSYVFVMAQMLFFRPFFQYFEMLYFERCLVVLTSFYITVSSQFGYHQNKHRACFILKRGPYQLQCWQSLSALQSTFASTKMCVMSNRSDDVAPSQQ